MRRWGRGAIRVALLTVVLVAVVLAASLTSLAAQTSTTVIGATTLATTPGFAVIGRGQNVPVFQGDTSGGYTLTAPASGTIVSWSFMSAGVDTGASFVLRVLHPADNTGNNWTATTTSPVVSVTGGGPGVDALQGPFTSGVSLPVQAGDRIGLQPTDGPDTPTEPGVAGRDGVRFFASPFADGTVATTDPASSPDSAQVVPIQATLQYSATAPIASITVPANGASLSLGQIVNSSFTCADGANGPGIARCVDQSGRASGSPVDTSTAGPHAFTVTATSRDGQVSTATASYTVVAPPPTARLVAQTLKGRLVLDASASHGNGAPIAGYAITLSDLPSEVITCGADSPVVMPVLTQAGAGVATLKVLSADGSSTSATAAFAAPGVAPVVRAAAHHASGATTRLIAYQCLPTGGALLGDYVQGAGSAHISSACQLSAGIVQIVGCGLQPVADLCTGVPAAERSILEGHIVKQTGVKRFTGPCGDSLSEKLLSHLAGAILTHPKDFDGLFDGFWVSTQPVRVNGIDVTPRSGSAVVVAVGGRVSDTFKPFSAYLVSSNAATTLGGFPLPVSSKLDLDVSNNSVLRPDTPCPNGPAAMDLPLGQFSLMNPFNLPTLLRVINEQNPGTPLASLPQLPVTGALTVALTAHGGSTLSLNVALNRVLDDPKDPDGNFTGCTVLTATNQTGVDVNHFEINAAAVNLGVPVQFKFVYDRPTRSFTGAFAVDVDSLKGQVGGAIEFLNGVFKDASANYTADQGGGYPIGGGFFIVKIDGKFYIYQRAIPGSHTEVDADMRISLGPAVDNNGCGLIDAEGNSRFVFYPGPLSVDLSGSMELYCYPVISRYFHADAAGHVEIGLQAGFDLGVIGFNFNVDGQAFYDFQHVPRVQLDGSGSGSLDLPDPIGKRSVTLTGSISDRGAGFCASIKTALHTFELGVGETFIPPPVNQLIFLRNLNFMWDGCDLSQYQTLAPGGPPTAGARQAQASQAYTLTVPAGNQTTVLALQGSGDAPSVTLHGPGGRTIDTATDALSGTELVVRQPSAGVTLVELAGQKAGEWTVTPDAGSAPIALVRTAHVMAPPQIKATVTRHGLARVLHYRITPRPGMTVTFLERGKGGSELIGPARGSGGTISFTPSFARTGSRQIIAEITQNGLPSPSLTVARYAASRPVPGRVSHLAISYRNGGVLVSFRPAPLATSHEVAITLSDGRGLRLLAGPGHRSVFVAAVPPATTVRRLAVYGIADGVYGARVMLTAPGMHRG